MSREIESLKKQILAIEERIKELEAIKTTRRDSEGETFIDFTRHWKHTEE